MTPHRFQLPLTLALFGASPLLAQTPAPLREPGLPAQLHWGDYDADGLDDALAITPGGRITLLRNAGDGSFEDATLALGLDGIVNARFAVWQDFDGDGLADLFVGTDRGSSYLMHNAGAFFMDVTVASGLTATGTDVSAHWIDYDGDGRLDLHLVSASDNTLYHALAAGGFEPVALPPLAGPSGVVMTSTAPDDATSSRSLPGRASEAAGELRKRRTVSGGRRAPGSSGTQAAVDDRADAMLSSQTVSSDAFGVCADTIRDQGNASCMKSSSTATLGMLYPLSGKFFVDEATGNVGIGTASPSETLDVQGSMAVDTDTLYVDDTANKVAVGTSTPFSNAKLSVIGSATERGIRVQGGSIAILDAVPAPGTPTLILGSNAVLDQASSSIGMLGSGVENAGFAWYPSLTGGGARIDVAFGPDSEPSSNTPRFSFTNTGRLGIGTTAPSAQLHVFGGSSGIAPTNADTKIMVESAGRAFLDIATGTDAAGINFSNSSGASDGSIFYGGGSGRDMVFRTGAQNNRMVIDGMGRVGINTPTPTFTLEVNGSAGKPGGGSWSVSSDRRLKKNIQDLDGALETLLDLRGVSFEYKDPKAVNELAGERIGFIAQEVEEVVPDWVEEIDGYKRLTIRGFEALAVEAMRELESKNAELEARVAQLESIEAELAGLQATIATLV